MMKLFWLVNKTIVLFFFLSKVTSEDKWIKTKIAIQQKQVTLAFCKPVVGPPFSMDLILRNYGLNINQIL
jgi:hypothetical protein